MRTATRLALLIVAAVASSCGAGIEAQRRPKVVAFDPADGTVLPGWLAYVRVTYDEPVRVLNEYAVRIRADSLGDDGRVPCRVYPDPGDDRSVLVTPLGDGHFFPGLEHHLVMQEGAVANGDDHYALDEFDAYFTVGPRPNAFVTADDGRVYEIALPTGALVAVTDAPAGHRARDPLGAGSRVWVWLDPVAPGPSLLGTMLPGAAAVAPVALSGEVGPRRGAGLALSVDGRTLYAVAEDPGAGTVLVHRVDTATLAEVGAPLALSAPLSATPGAFAPSVDRDRNRLLVPVAAPGGTGVLCFVDLAAFAEVDAGPAVGLDGCPIAGAGPCFVEELRDVAFVLQSEEATAAIVRVDLWDLDTDADPELTIPGKPRAIYATGDARYAIQGLDGYAAGEGLVKTRAWDLDEGFPVVVPDDGGAGSIGATRVGALLRDPASDYLWVFADDGVRSVLSAFDGVEEDFEAVDLDPGLDGVQGVDLQGAVPSPVNGATVLRGYP